MKTIGNYLNQPNRDFPLDADGLATLQDNAAAIELLGAIAGDKTIITGCEENEAGTNRTAGWVWAKTDAAPDGELLYFEGGSPQAGMYIASESVEVQGDGYTYPSAYTKRTLKPGYGSEQFDWDDFSALSSTSALKEALSALTTTVNAIKPVPAGVVEMWAGGDVPDGYLLCDGSELFISVYPALYAALGTRFNTAKLWNGVTATTAAGKFRLPDLRGRFIVGQNAQDTDYQTLGTSGGEKKTELTEDQLPAHSHKMKDFVQIPNGSSEITSGSVTIDGASATAGSVSISGVGKRAQTSSGATVMQYITHDTEDAGTGDSHENRPPFYALAYIIKCK